MKTQGMAHQLEALRRLAGREFFALFMEQGTGKTWVALADAERRYAAGQIEGVLAIAPKGVHTNWIRREAPAHLSCEWVGASYHGSSPTKKQARALTALMEPRDLGEVPPLRIFAINIDAVNSENGFRAAIRFLNSVKCLIVVDESHTIKNPDSARTKRVLRMKPLSAARLIMSGTPVTNSPLDVFGQFEFLEEGLLGTTSYRSFVAEFSELMSNDHPQMKNMIKKNPRIAFAQVVAKGPDGAPRWRNLDKLHRLIAPHAFRVLKRDCLDLPEKIYQTRYFDLTPAQRAAYERLGEEKRITIDEETHAVDALAAMNKLRQLTSGFVIIDGEARELVEKGNPRLDALRELIEELEGRPAIIWAHYRAEIAAIGRLLAEIGVAFVEYHGGVKSADREAAVDDFQAGKAQVFLGQPGSGGVGLTLTRAENTVYYSHDFNNGVRLQSEDRNHRIGTKANVVYTDIVALDTLDEAISRALQRKSSIAAEILRDGVAQALPADFDELAGAASEIAQAIIDGDVIEAPAAPSFIEAEDAAASFGDVNEIARAVVKHRRQSRA